MYKTLGICGYSATGSSAYSDLLHEFDNTQVLDYCEFNLAYFPDALEDLEYHVKKHDKYMSSVVAINRFRNFIRHGKSTIILKSKMKEISESFLNDIIQISWNGYGSIDRLIRPFFSQLMKRCIFYAAKKLKYYRLLYSTRFLFSYMLDFSITPENFDIMAKRFISDVLDAMGREQDLITVLDQPFDGTDPVKSFKYFENPKAIIVDRDPRDYYLFLKNFLRPRGRGFQIPCNNVKDYIKFYRLTRQTASELRKRDDVMFFNLEELVYNYEETIIKASKFSEAGNHIHKGKYFMPSHSRNNTQLFKKYTGFDSDIKKIETELAEYLFPFENYPDIEPEGGMFFGSQNKKKR